MTKGQKITMWIFGILISIVIYMVGLHLTDDTGTYTTPTGGFVAVGIPLIIIGSMFFFSFSKKK